MIIKEIDNITYQINLPNSNINIYNKDSLERITKKIFKKITNKKKLNPLLILDIYENNAYDIQNELLSNYKDLNLITLIASVRDRERLREIFRK